MVVALMSVRSLVRSAFPLTVLVLAVLAAAPAQAKTAPRYFERLVAEDTENDYQSNGALDIVAIHLSERYSYSSETRSGNETVQFRLQLRDRDQIKQLPPDHNNGTSSYFVTPIQYTIGFTAGGKAQVYTVVLNQECIVKAGLSGAGADCNAREPVVPKPHYSTKDAESGGVTIVLVREKAGLPVGTAISKVWAASALLSQGQATYQDVAPKDNANQPEGGALTAPTTPDKAYPLQGTFPFLTASMRSSALQYAIPGGSAAFVFEFRTNEGISGIDHVYVDAAPPAGWTIEGNLGTDFITTAGGQTVEYELRAKAPAFAKAGEQAKFTVKASLQGAGGHQEIPVEVDVSGSKVEAPDYVFALQTPGPFKAESASVLRWQVAHDGVPLEHFRVAADFLLNGKVVDAAIPATEKEPGVYEVAYTFSSGGAWTADLYIAELQPSPHAASQVVVSSADGGLLPGFGLLGAWAALGLAAWRRT
jgi:YtkA-like protein